MARNSRGAEQFNGCKQQGRADAVRPIPIQPRGNKVYNCQAGHYQPPYKQQA